MRIVALSAAALLGTCVVGYYVVAQPAEPLHVIQYSDPVRVQVPVPSNPYIASAPAYAPAPVVAQHYAPSNVGQRIGGIETTLVGLARTYGRTIDAAVEDNVISNEVAVQLAEEIAFMLRVKGVRIDLYRAANTLGELERDGKGLAGWPEAQELKQMLPKLEGLKLNNTATEARREANPSEPRSESKTR